MRALVLLACSLLLQPSYAFRRSDWKLPMGFEIALYSDTPVNSARSLSCSGSSKRGGPIITYVGARSSEPQDVVALVDRTGRGKAHYVQTIIKGLCPQPNGVAWNKGSLFIACPSQLYRLDNADSYALSKKAAPLSALKLVLTLPAEASHGWKFIRFGPDNKLYIPIGAPCNACKPGSTLVNGRRWQFGSIYRVNRNGSNVTLVAQGVRNTVGFDFHPLSKQLFFTDNGRDQISDNVPDCELNRVSKEGEHFGFPFCHTRPAGGSNPRPYLRRPGRGTNLADPDLNRLETVWKCNGPGLRFTPAVQALGPHVAPLGMRFYRWSAAANFPQGYNNSIIIAEHGSWNRASPIGARLVRVRLNTTSPGKVVSHTPFLSGGVPGDKGLPGGPNPPATRASSYLGRPVDVEQLPDGSLLVSDDEANAVYRIWYTPPPG